MNYYDDERRDLMQKPWSCYDKLLTDIYASKKQAWLRSIQQLPADKDKTTTNSSCQSPS